MRLLHFATLVIFLFNPNFAAGLDLYDQENQPIQTHHFHLSLREQSPAFNDKMTVLFGELTHLHHGLTEKCLTNNKGQLIIILPNSLRSIDQILLTIQGDLYLVGQFRSPASTAFCFLQKNSILIKSGQNTGWNLPEESEKKEDTIINNYLNNAGNEQVKFKVYKKFRIKQVQEKIIKKTLNKSLFQLR